MVKAGADGYLLKDEDPLTLSEAIRTVAEGKPWFSGAVTGKMIAVVTGKSQVALGEKLTKREQEVLRLLAEGSTNKEIAVALQTSKRTVEFHVGNILSKLGAKGRWEAVNLAREKNLL
jgi:DNA-binding NarL/FixJ family response regulator